MCQPASLACLVFKVDPIVMTKNVSVVSLPTYSANYSTSSILQLLTRYILHFSQKNILSVLSQLRINLHSFAFHPLLRSKILMSGCLHAVSPGYCVPGLYDTCFCGPLCSALTITSRESFLIPPHHMCEAGRWAGSQPASQDTRDTSQAHCDVRLTGGTF